MKRKRLFIIALLFLVPACNKLTTSPSITLEPSAKPTQSIATQTTIPLFLNTPTVPSPTQTPIATLVPLEAFQKGISFTAWSRGVYSLPDTKLVLSNQIVPIGANWISLIVQCYQETVFSVEIDCQSDSVPSDDELLSVIQIAHADGLRVMLKPSIEFSKDEITEKLSLIGLENRISTELSIIEGSYL